MLRGEAVRRLVRGLRSRCHEQAQTHPRAVLAKVQMGGEMTGPPPLAEGGRVGAGREQRLGQDFTRWVYEVHHWRT
ncbi:hypothetical protein GCM10012320_02840 [Sinomonas cellulolyticus]|nr:hypothetical protein GCM10012320_02840 [Sinomonas sp. KCTC 49339]